MAILDCKSFLQVSYCLVSVHCDGFMIRLWFYRQFICLYYFCLYLVKNTINLLNSCDLLFSTHGYQHYIKLQKILSTINAHTCLVLKTAVGLHATNIIYVKVCEVVSMLDVCRSITPGNGSTNLYKTWKKHSWWSEMAIGYFLSRYHVSEDTAEGYIFF